jgi:hypothetical protein
MNDEFRRLQELAGIKEMKVDNPLTVNIKRLETGDKLIVIKTVYWDEEGDKPTLTPQQGEYGVFTYKDDVWELKKDNILVATCIQSNDPYSVGNTILIATIISISRLGAFKHIRKSEVKEIKIGNPIPLKNLKVGDKLRVVKNVYNTSPNPNIRSDSRVNMIQTTEPTSRSRVPDYLWVIGEIWVVESTDGLGVMKCISNGENYNHINHINIKYTQNLIDMGVFKYENRLQELAGINEMKIGNPIKVDPRRLKVGDKLRVKKEVYRVSDPENPRGPSLYFNTAEEANAVEPRGNRLSYIDVGDVYIVTGFAPGIDPSKPKIYLECREIGDDIGPTTALRLINFGVFEYA